MSLSRGDKEPHDEQFRENVVVAVVAVGLDLAFMIRTSRVFPKSPRV